MAYMISIDTLKYLYEFLRETDSLGVFEFVILSLIFFFFQLSIITVIHTTIQM